MRTAFLLILAVAFLASPVDAKRKQYFYLKTKQGSVSAYKTMAACLAQKKRLEAIERKLESLPYGEKDAFKARCLDFHPHGYEWPKE